MSDRKNDFHLGIAGGTGIGFFIGLLMLGYFTAASETGSSFWIALSAMGTLSAAIAAVWTAWYTNKKVEERIREERRRRRQENYNAFASQSLSGLRTIEQRYGQSVECLLLAFDMIEAIKSIDTPVPVPPIFLTTLNEGLISHADILPLRDIQRTWNTLTPADMSTIIFDTHRAIEILRAELNMVNFQMTYVTDFRDADSLLDHLGKLVVQHAKSFHALMALIPAISPNTNDDVWTQSIEPRLRKLEGNLP